MSDIPRIDERVQHVGVSELRRFNRKYLRAIGDSIVVICDNLAPLAVLVPYGMYVAMQQVISAEREDTSSVSIREVRR